jgi:hypothetical protein
VAFDRGLSPAVRDAVTARIINPGEIRDRLHRGPQFLTHYDFHHGNIGRADDDDVAIIDWAYVGWGPAGRDVGHLVLDTWDHLPDFAAPIEAWDDLTGTYSAALREHGWNGNPAEALAGIRSLFPDASSILNISPINVWNVGHYHQDRRWTGEIDSAGPLIAAASRRSCRVFCADPC